VGRGPEPEQVALRAHFLRPTYCDKRARSGFCSDGTIQITVRHSPERHPHGPQTSFPESGQGRKSYRGGSCPSRSKSPAALPAPASLPELHSQDHGFRCRLQYLIAVDVSSASFQTHIICFHSDPAKPGRNPYTIFVIPNGRKAVRNLALVVSPQGNRGHDHVRDDPFHHQTASSKGGGTGLGQKPWRPASSNSALPSTAAADAKMSPENRPPNSLATAIHLSLADVRNLDAVEP